MKKSIVIAILLIVCIFQSFKIYKNHLRIQGFEAEKEEAVNHALILKEAELARILGEQQKQKNALVKEVEEKVSEEKIKQKTVKGKNRE